MAPPMERESIAVDELIRIIDLCPEVIQRPFALVGYSMAEGFPSASWKKYLQDHPAGVTGS